MKTEFRRCFGCGQRVRVRGVMQTLAVHYFPTHGWTPRANIPAVTRCEWSDTHRNRHAAIEVKARERGTCPGCGRSVALTPRGLLHAHACENPPRHGEPPARRPLPNGDRTPARRGIRVRGDE